MPHLGSPTQTCPPGGWTVTCPIRRASRDGPLLPGARAGGGDIGGPDQPTRVWHGCVQRHHVQVAGVASQDVPDQVGGARGGQFRVDRGLPAETSLTGRHLRRPAGPADVHWWHRPVRAHPDPPRIQQQASQITSVVGVQVAEEHPRPAERSQARRRRNRTAYRGRNRSRRPGRPRPARTRSRPGQAPAAAHRPYPAAPVQLPCAPSCPANPAGMMRPSGDGSGPGRQRASRAQEVPG